MIELTHISKQFGGQSVFQDFSLSVADHEFVAITGESGAGKSTLLNIIGLLDRPDRGDVMIDGVKNPDLNKKTGRSLVKDHMAYLFQNFALIEKQTARQNLLLVCRLKKLKMSDEIVTKTVETLGLSPLLHKKIYQLSGGEQQRVALARVFIKNPDIILADEPTASLDPGNAQIVMDSLCRLHKNGATIVMVTHNPELAALADRTVPIAKNTASPK